MRYYIKPSDKDEVSGPFGVEELNLQIADGKIGSDWLATSDLGESVDSIRRSSRNDWFWIAGIPGVVGVERPKHPEKKEFNLLLIFILIVLLGASLFVGFFIVLRIWLGHIQ